MPLADYALVVGIDAYPGISDLSGAERDALAFLEWVTSPDGGNVAKPNAECLVSSNYPRSLNVDLAEPAKKAVEDFFTRIDNVAEENNHASLGFRAGKRLWLFFAGHGFAPSLDRSGVLLANATPRRVHNIAARSWADRLYEGGWFEQVILFQDACRGRIKDADLNVPFLRPRQASGGVNRGRFYGFAATYDKVAREVMLPSGHLGGVFTATLLAGLRGAARHPMTDALTTAHLKDYLEQNMSKLLPAADLDDEEVSKRPEISNPDPFEILPPRPLPTQGKFPVRISISDPSGHARLEDHTFQPIYQVEVTPAIVTLVLPRGLYRLLVSGSVKATFSVDGSLDAAGDPITEVVNV